jgi:hypothetical protein
VVNQIDDANQDKAIEGAGYLIYIVTQEALFNDEISTITYFKDITFGVLYEQIKLQNQLQTMMSSTLQSKMGNPLGTIVRTIESVESCEAVSKIKHDTSYNLFKDQLRHTKFQAQLILF